MTRGANQDPGAELAGRGALRPKARLLRTLGSDLISSDKVALIELVKNSYDADAGVVLIRFRGPLKAGEGGIEVWDDGHGMDAATLQSSWLDIATDTKRRNPRSDGGRRVLGEKGIGRLATARLGEEMLLTTRKQDADEVKLLIDWTDFDREDAYLDEIEVAWEVGAPDVFAANGAAAAAFSELDADGWHQERGTVLQVDRLSREWTRDDLLELRTALTRLIRPRPQGSGAGSAKDASTEPDFQIVLELTDVDDTLEDLAGPIEPSADLRTPHYRLSGSIDVNGSATLHYEQQDPPETQDIGVMQLWNLEDRPPQAGPFEFEISVWDRDKTALQRSLQAANPENTAPSASDLKGFRDTMDEVAGVSIYRDGFRVLPFGETGDDWLGLDLRRVQSPTLRLSNNQIIGHVFIGADTNESLKDQSNREGILAGAAYADLQYLVRAALNQLEQRRYGARHPKKEQPERKGGLFERFDLGEISTALKQSYPGDKRLHGLIDEKNRDIQEGVTQVQNVLSRYSRLATLGALIDRVLHDGRTVVTRLKNIARFGTRDLNKPSVNNSDKVSIALGSMTDTAEQAELLSSLFKQIEPFGGRKRGRPKQISVSEVIDRAISILQQEADDRNVQLVGGGTDIAVKIDEAELLTVLVNLIQNAIYWTATQPQGIERKVLVGARTNEDESLTLVVSDSGPGVPSESRDYIFDPYFSSKPDGVGLGLSIVGNLVEDIYAGELTLVDEGALDGATFEATFRRRV
ncbi:MULTISPECIES: sensor histidine kinase [Micrococcales]|uniref:histidine kinase n=2 Tax=Micrococcales TaxID=85006 RepID=A0A5B8M1Y6_9MICO|nr:MULTISPECIES: ATP-binding protein [Micrococcales]QDZ14667.1 histidine kinase [Humibacter ginsenosidimutans]WFP16604.1 ATP-binding protein [Citricoccus muralis]